MLLIIQQLKSYLISFGSVIAQIDWAIQKKELDLEPAPYLIRGSIRLRRRIMTNIGTGFAMNYMD